MAAPLRNISLATRLALVALLVTLTSLAVTASVGLARGSTLADEVVDDRITATAASKAADVQNYFASVRRELGALASSPAIARDIEELTGAVVELANEPVDATTAQSVADHYLSEVVPALEKANGGASVDAAGLIPTGSAALTLQQSFTVTTETESGTVLSPELIVDPGDGTAYSELHADRHRTYSAIAQQAQVDDVFLIDVDNELVVYSYRKRIEFGTGLSLGPHSGSALSRSVDALALDPEQPPLLSSVGRYVPATEQPTMFVASSVFDADDRHVGYIAYAISHERLDQLVSSDNRTTSLGPSGEAYLVNADATMITTVNSFEADRAAFRNGSFDPGPGQLTDAQRQRLVATQTTALVQTVSPDIVTMAADGAGLTDTVNYRGVSVRSAIVPLDIEGVSWTLVVEAPTAELDATVEDFARDMLVAVALFVVAVAFIAVRWSTRLVAPIRAIANRLRRTRSLADEAPNPLTGSAALEPDRAASLATPDVDDDSDPGPTEFVDLAGNVDEMLLRLRDRREAVAARSRERTSLLQQFLPAAIARRSEETDSEVLDHARQASVAVVQLEGLGALVGDAPEQEVRDLLGELIDEIDGEAAEAGLERVQLSGSTYYAVCGAGRPVLDHAPRTVGFALRVRDLVAEVTDGRLAAKIGVAEGPVSVGLAERSALVYDAWGATIRSAEELSVDAPPGGVLVSDIVTVHLPDDYLTGGDVGDGRALVTGRIDQGVTS